MKRGDTIIEVLLAMAIMGVVLAAAYATASRSLRTSRLTQERTEAMRFAEGQIELMKSLQDTARNDLFARPNSDTFCINDTAVVVEENDPACRVNFYTKTIDKQLNPTTSRPFFTVKVMWDPPGGTSTNQAEVTLTYGYPQ